MYSSCSDGNIIIREASFNDDSIYSYSTSYPLFRIRLTWGGRGRYTLRRNSSLHCISSSKPSIQLHNNSSTVTEMKIYSGMGYLFWECMTLKVFLDLYSLHIWICILYLSYWGEELDCLPLSSSHKSNKTLVHDEYLLLPIIPQLVTFTKWPYIANRSVSCLRSSPINRFNTDMYPHLTGSWVAIFI